MAVRRWAVQPDTPYETSQGTIGVVSREAMVEAIMDGEAMLARSGGVLTVIVGRAPTDLPGEMVTTNAVVEWKDRTDAKERPEQPTTALPEAVTASVERGLADARAGNVTDGPDLARAREVAEGIPDEALDEARSAHSPDNPDGFVPLEEEDLDSVPAEAR